MIGTCTSDGGCEYECEGECSSCSAGAAAAWCANCSCESATCGLSAADVELCPGGDATLIVTASCTPCGTMTVGLEKSVPYLTITPASQAVPCDGSTRQLHFNVAITPAVQLTFDGVAEQDETDPGGFLCVNDDDDNSNGTPDKDETTPIIGENDLVSLTIALDSAWTGQGTITLSCEAGCNLVKIYEEINRASTNNPSILGMVNLPACWSATQPGCRSWSELPETLYVEGQMASTMLRDVELTALYEGEGGPCEDHVRLTIVGIETIVPDMPTKVLISMLHGGGYPSSQQTTDRKIRVRATLQPPVVGHEVYFRSFDPDDKSPYEADLLGDDNRHADLRRGALEVPAGVTEIAGSRQLDANGNVIAIGVISTTGGFAEVDLQITDRYSGDNYIIAGHCGPNPALTNKKSGNLVAWKRVYLERDNMYMKGGTVTVSFTPDTNTMPDTLMLDSTADLSAGDMITIFSPTTSVSTVVSAKTPTSITVPDLAVAFDRLSGVRKTSETATFDAPLTYIPMTYGSDAEGIDGGGFVEFQPSPSGSGSIPHFAEFPSDPEAKAFCQFWFDNRAGNANLVQLVAADKHVDGSLGTTFPSDNISIVTVAQHTSTPSLLDTVAHELGHQFNVSNSHVDSMSPAPNHNGTDDCLMTYHSDDTDGISEFDLDCIGDVRERTDPN